MALGSVRARRWRWLGSAPGWAPMGTARLGPFHRLRWCLCGLAGAWSAGTACWGRPPALAQRRRPLGPASPTPLQPVSSDSARRPPTVLGPEAAGQPHPCGRGWPGPCSPQLGAGGDHRAFEELGFGGEGRLTCGNVAKETIRGAVPGLLMSGEERAWVRTGEGSRCGWGCGPRWTLPSPTPQPHAPLQ